MTDHPVHDAQAPRTVVLAGAGGFIGTHLARRFAEDGVRVRTIGRGPAADARWGEDLTSTLAGADALINLSGRSVDCRYTKKTADEIFRSRTETTRTLGETLAKLETPPVWLNASTGTIYRDARDRPQDEDSGELGTGFSVAVARAWEQELWDAPGAGRRAALRMSIVLGRGGALSPLINLARLGAGGRHGDGDQRLSWIHIEDVYRSVRHIIATESLSGPVNLASPQILTNREVTAAVRRQFGGPIGRRVGAPLPAWALEMGARIIRTEAELVLKSRWVQPRRLIDSGFEFAFHDIDDALANLSSTHSRTARPHRLENHSAHHPR